MKGVKTATQTLNPTTPILVSKLVGPVRIPLGRVSYLWSCHVDVSVRSETVGPTRHGRAASSARPHPSSNQGKEGKEKTCRRNSRRRAFPNRPNGNQELRKGTRLFCRVFKNVTQTSQREGAPEHRVPTIAVGEGEPTVTVGAHFNVHLPTRFAENLKDINNRAHEFETFLVIVEFPPSPDAAAATTTAAAVSAAGVFLLRRLRTLLSLLPSPPPVDIALAAAPCSLTSPFAPSTCSLTSPSPSSPSGFALLPLVPSVVAGASLVLPPPVPFAGLVIALRLTKENYFPWSAAMTMGIAGRGRIAYIDGRNPKPAKTSAGLNDEFEGVRSQILNSGEVSSIEDVYSCIEAEEQRRLVTTEGKRDLMPYHERSALVSRGPGGTTRSLRRCTHCKKTGHTVDYCWDLHPEKKGNKERSSIGKTLVSEVPKSSGEKVSISADQIRELRAYLGQINVNQV
ncbi:hypothetical protein EJ110_NYTH59175 [Nymphaea thermarum]|nr:hypothetical protein EJ110_NYTH59175 [Nymphaea thermarum]